MTTGSGVAQEAVDREVLNPVKQTSSDPDEKSSDAGKRESIRNQNRPSSHKALGKIARIRGGRWFSDLWTSRQEKGQKREGRPFRNF